MSYDHITLLIDCSKLSSDVILKIKIILHFSLILHNVDIQVRYSEHSLWNSTSLVLIVFEFVYLLTGLAPPTHVRAGVVTDSSIELLWDRAEGDSHHYEALCMNCADSVMVRSCV